MAKPKKRVHKKDRAPHLLAPSVWPTWCVVGLIWCLVRLPLPMVSALGRSAGRLLYTLGRSRRQITLRNLELCFPDLSQTERIELAKDTFRHVGMGALELMIPWLNPRKDLMANFRIEGLEHLNEAVEKNRGVILLGGHYSVMDVISPALATCGPIDVMYRFNKNPAWEWLQLNGRKRYFEGVIEREDTRDVLRHIKKGRVIWYAADQDYGRKHSVFAPFFGIDAATITATARFAKLNNSPVLFLQHTKDMKTGQWVLKYHPILENYPSGNDVADATRINAELEKLIRENPSQYLWLHKRFKTRPEGEKSLY